MGGQLMEANTLCRGSYGPTDHCPLVAQVAEEVFSLSRVVRTFGTEATETARYAGWLQRLRHLGIRQSTAYLIYLASNSTLFYLTKVGCAPARLWVRFRLQAPGSSTSRRQAVSALAPLL